MIRPTDHRLPIIDFGYGDVTLIHSSWLLTITGEPVQPGNCETLAPTVSDAYRMASVTAALDGWDDCDQPVIVQGEA